MEKLSKHSEAVAQPIILFGQSMTSLVTDSIFGPTVPSFSMQKLKIDRKPPVILASLFRGPMAFSTSFRLRYCFDALSEPDLLEHIIVAAQKSVNHLMKTAML